MMGSRRIFCVAVLFATLSILKLNGEQANPGVIKYPDSCSDKDCMYILKWRVSNDSNSVHFQLIGDAKDTHSWVAVGFGETNSMPNSGIVECIQSSNGPIVIQASYNVKFKNYLLNDRQLGLIPELSSGEVVDGKIRCNFTHVIKVDQSHPEASKVKDLEMPHYILLVHGSATLQGVKQKHHKPVYKSGSKVNILYTNQNENIQRSLFVKLHGVIMVIVWMLLVSIGTITSRYLKSDWLQGVVVCNKALWFQIHRSAMITSSMLVLVGLLFIFSESGWTYYQNTHSIMGLTVMTILIVNIFLGSIRPNLESPRRVMFNFVHGVFGHSAHLLGILTLFFGLRTEYAMLPYWVSWIAIGFGIFRLFIDLVLTLLRHYNQVSSGYSELVENGLSSENNAWVWRYAFIVVYLIVSFATTLTIVIAICVCPPVNHDN